MGCDDSVAMEQLAGEIEDRIDRSRPGTMRDRLKRAKLAMADSDDDAEESWYDPRLS